MLTEIPSGVFQVPDNALWILALWLLSLLATGWTGYRWGLRSQKEAEKLKLKLSILPLIEGFIGRASKGEFMQLRHDFTNGLFEPAVKLKSLLNGCQKRSFIEKWEHLYNTTKEECHHPQPNETEKQCQEMRQIVISRLDAFRKIVEKI